MADLFAYVQGQDNTLAGSGVTLSATTATFESLTFPEGTLITMADFGTTGYGTFEPETAREENFSFTGLTQNVSGTATLTGITRGLAFKAPYTADSSLRQAHAGGSVMRFTNSAPFYGNFASKGNDETIAETWTFTSTDVPRMDAAPTYGVGTEEYLATKRYVDGVALSGAPNASTTAKGVVEEATQSEVDARTQTGATGADLFVNPTTVRASKYNDFAASSGGTDTYAITITPTLSAYADGQVFVFEADVANTGAATLNVSSLGAKTIKKYGSKDLESNDIVAGSIITVAYDLDSDTFMLQTPVAKQQISQTGAEIFALDAQASDTYVVTLSPAPVAYVTGMVVNFGANTANTGPATLNVNSLGAIAIKRQYNLPLVTGDIQSGQYITVIYDGTNFQMITPPSYNTLIPGFNFTCGFLEGGGDNLGSTGFSDASEDSVTIGLGDNANDDYDLVKLGISGDIGSAIYFVDSDVDDTADPFTPSDTHPLYMGSSYWFCNVTGTQLRKDGGTVTYSGTARYGALGHDNTNSSLLILYSTTKIAKFSGIAGTTITNLNTDVTLDTAVTLTGFAFDDLNDQYVCLDKTANLLRKFGSTGTTVETAAYTVDDTNIFGVCIIGERYYLVGTKVFTTGATAFLLTAFFIPTTMRRG